jgi:stress response protein YsnF
MPEDYTSHGSALPVPGLAPGPDSDRHLTVDVFDTFTNAVIDLDEHGEELVLTRQAWVKQELVITRRVTERTAVVRDVVRRVDVDVDTFGSTPRNRL